MKPHESNLYIVGAGDLVREIIWLVRCLSSAWQIKGVLTDKSEQYGVDFGGVSVVGSHRDWKQFSNASFIVSVGSPDLKNRLIEEMKESGCPKFATLVHPSAQIGERVHIGKGSVITSNCVLTVDISIGEHTLINLASSVGHDVTIGNCCNISPHSAISGNVTIGDNAVLGTSSVVVPGVALGQGCFVGAGSVVTKNVREYTLVMGVPAKKIRALQPPNVCDS